MFSRCELLQKQTFLTVHRSGGFIFGANATSWRKGIRVIWDNQLVWSIIQGSVMGIFKVDFQRGKIHNLLRSGNTSKLCFGGKWNLASVFLNEYFCSLNFLTVWWNVFPGVIAAPPSPPPLSVSFFLFIHYSLNKYCRVLFFVYFCE